MFKFFFASILFYFSFASGLWNFSYIILKLNKWNILELNYLTNYSVIEPQFGSLNYGNDIQSRSHLSFKAFNKWFMLTLNELEQPPGIQRTVKLLDSFGNDWIDEYFSIIKHFEASFDSMFLLCIILMINF